MWTPQGTLHYGSSGTYLPVKGPRNMATVTFDNASRIYPGTERPAVDSLQLDIADGEFLVLVGPSGCGKSTSLRMLAGLEDVDKGSIWVGDRDVTHVQPKDRDIAMVFQSYALYPHMTVADNMGFALKIAKTDKAEIRKRVEDAAKILDLTEYLDRKPKALSGGQRQRVAMGRAIVRQPQVFLMDEPLSNLDAKLRVQTRTQIAALQRRLGTTTVYVTHDQVEALTMGDRIAVLKDGVLQQVGTPRDMYDAPANVFVAGFIGSPAMNISTFKVEDGKAIVGPARVPLKRETLDNMSADDNSEVVLGWRPESMDRVAPNSEGALPIEVVVVEELGSDAFVYGQLPTLATTLADPKFGGTGEVIVRVDPRDVPEKGSTMWVTIREGEQHAFSATTGKRISPSAASTAATPTA